MRLGVAVLTVLTVATPVRAQPRLLKASPTAATTDAGQDWR